MLGHGGVRSQVRGKRPHLLLPENAVRHDGVVFDGGVRTVELRSWKQRKQVLVINQSGFFESREG